MIVLEQNYTFKLDKFICDAPARALLKGIKGHCGYHACERCIVKGAHDGRVVFDDVTCELRTDDAFSALLYMGTHQLKSVVLSWIQCT